MKIYLVGGAVRDLMLGLEPKDRDYVVVGSTPEEMLSLGYIQVGADFPVFLHPKTGDEYALARSEKKTGVGYNGFTTDFSPDVTLEQDLYRRDLTMNAMARDETDGMLFDPYNGKEDLDNGIIRHVSEAFAEDPVRVLRVARFAARYSYVLHPTTQTLMTQLVNTGELNNLTAERVWKETERALAGPNSDTYFKVLHECGALQVLIPELYPLHCSLVFDSILQAYKNQFKSEVIFACLLHNINDGSIIAAVCDRMKVGVYYKHLAVLVGSNHLASTTVFDMDAETLWSYMFKTDVIRRPGILEDFTDACEAIHTNTCIEALYIRNIANAVRDVNITMLKGGIDHMKGMEIQAALTELRINAIKDLKIKFTDFI
jgi:tRNA nucleotidyltransferase (CCA-adding enzyme)